MHSRSIASLFSIVTLAAAPISWLAEREQAAGQHAAGNYREAEMLYRSALAKLKNTAPGDPHIPEILNDLGVDCYLLGNYAEAEGLYRDALALWRARAATPADVIARGLGNLATTYRARKLYAGAEAAYREALQMLDGVPGYAAQFASTLSNLADVYLAQDRVADALASAQTAVTILEDLGETGSARLPFALQTLAAIEQARGHQETAAKLYRRALTLLIAENGEDHPAVAAAKNNIADIDIKQGDYAEAERLSREALSTWQRKLGPGHPRVGVAAANLAQALRFQRRFEDATIQFERAIEILTGGDLAHCLANYADMNFQQGRPAAAVHLYRKAIDAAQRSFGAEHPKTAMIMARLAEVRRGQGLYAESVKLYRRALPILESSPEAAGDSLRTVRAQYDATLKESAKTMLVR